LLQFGATDNSLNNVWFFQNKPSRKRIYSYFKWCDRQLEKITVRNPQSIFLLILIVIFKNFCRNVPDNYKILFMQGGGTAQFAAVPLNLLRPEKTVCDPSLLCKRMWISCFLSIFKLLVFDCRLIMLLLGIGHELHTTRQKCSFPIIKLTFPWLVNNKNLPQFQHQMNGK
jgi:hypothetical protein